MRRVEYYATLGPSCCEETVLRKMFQKGMTGARLNLSHINLTQCEDLLSAYFNAAKGILERPGLLIDLQGPELRIGILEQPIVLEDRDQVLLTDPVEESPYVHIPVPKEVLWNVKRQQLILLDDGKILLEVSAVLNRQNEEVSDETCPMGGHVLCTVLRGGELHSRKSIALPGCKVHLPTLTAMDIKNIGVAKKYGVTGVMLPFVRNREDLLTLRKALKEVDATHIKILAKIENMEGVECLEELVTACDEIVIARGDLGNSVPLWELPGLQEQIAITCRQHSRRFMVVTQMLATMEHSAVPTRAEVTDIFHAVKQGASSVMLTGETAVGEYPVEAMEYLVNTGRAALARL